MNLWNKKYAVARPLTYRELLKDTLVEYEELGLLDKGLSERLDSDPKFIYLATGLLIDLTHREAIGLLKACIRMEKNGNLWISADGERQVALLGGMLIRRAARYCNTGELEDAGLLIRAVKELILAEMKWVEGDGKEYRCLLRELDKALEDWGFDIDGF